jgi:hypothetical protein
VVFQFTYWENVYFVDGQRQESHGIRRWSKAGRIWRNRDRLWRSSRPDGFGTGQREAGFGGGGFGSGGFRSGRFGSAFAAKKVASLYLDKLFDQLFNLGSAYNEE